MTNIHPLAALASFLSRQPLRSPDEIAGVERRVARRLALIPGDSQILALSRKNQDRLIQARREVTDVGAPGLVALIDRALALAGVPPEAAATTTSTPSAFDYNKLLE